MKIMVMMMIIMMMTMMRMIMRMITIYDVINKSRIKEKGGNDHVDRAGYCTK